MKTQWQVIEDIDGAYVYPVTDNPDDMCFGRIRPVAKLNEHAPKEVVSAFCALINGTMRRRKPAHLTMRLQHEHERQSNAAAIRDGAIIRARI